MSTISTSPSPATSPAAFDGTHDLRRRAGASDGAPGFSYALAAASLESGAAQSLKAHGATPDSRSAATTAKPAATDAGRPAVQRETTTRTANAEIAPQQTAQATKSPQHAPNLQQSAQPLPTAAAAPVATALSSPASIATAKAIDAIATRDAASTEKTKAAAARHARTAEPAILKPEFAAILARRLEKTSVFDLRLDPPELGRVEGRLTIGEDGKSVLSLSFDKESAFDLYSRDQQALRQALAEAGLDFGASDFRFSYREPQQGGPSFGAEPIPASDGAAHYEPVFFAQWSAGALDIRI